MKKLSIVLLTILAASPAYAEGDHGYGGGRDGGGWVRGGGWIFPALIGGAIIYDLTQPQVVVLPHTLVLPQTVYIQPPPAPAVQYWYFCAAANGYYPYVATCPTGWQAVPATPPAALPGGPYVAPAR